MECWQSTYLPWNSLNVRVWRSVSRGKIIDPILFSGTITAERCQAFIMNFSFLLEVDEQDCWSQQCGSTAQTANSTMQMLSEFFGGRIVCRNLWPPRPLDLSPLKGILKENVYKNNPHTSEELKQNTGLFKTKYTISRIYFTKTTDSKSTSCVWMKRKSLKVLIWISRQMPGAHTIILYAKGCYVQNGGKGTRESFLRAGIRQDNVSVKCETTF
jgi:hypothetical protein